MRHQSNIKFLFISMVLLSVTACSSSLPPQQTASSPIVQTEPSPWEQAYNESLANTENTFHHDTVFMPSNINTANVSVSTEDIWSRVRSNLPMSNSSDLNASTKKQLSWLLKHPKYLLRTSKRAEPYFYYIVGEVEKRNMPMEVALLPIVESAYKPYATSYVGAAGLWQFMPATGKRYGLKQNWWYDGRRDVIQSTQAALNYLQTLHDDLGSWELAFAAYNCGEGLVMRQMKRNEKAGKPTDFWSLKLPKETSAYVPKLIAVSHLIKYSDHYSVTLHPIQNTPAIAITNVGSQIELETAAKMAKISKEEIYQLNPGYSRWATDPSGSHQLVLPIEKVDLFQKNLQKLPKSRRVTWIRHAVKSGESLSVIADHYNTPVSIIKKVNRLPNNTIRVGNNLVIPRHAKGGSSIAAVNLGLQTPIKTYSKAQRYTVKNGDSLWLIARKYDVHVAQIKSWNPSVKSGTIKPGQKLLIKSSHQSKSSQAKTKRYTIKQGDSLWTISRKFNVTVAEVRKWNQLPKRNTLQPGQSLRIHLD